MSAWGTGSPKRSTGRAAYLLLVVGALAPSTLAAGGFWAGAQIWSARVFSVPTGVAGVLASLLALVILVAAIAKAVDAAERDGAE